MANGMPKDTAEACAGIDWVIGSIGHALVIVQRRAKFNRKCNEKDGAKLSTPSFRLSRSLQTFGC